MRLSLLFGPACASVALVVVACGGAIEPSGSGGSGDGADAAVARVDPSGASTSSSSAGSAACLGPAPRCSACGGSYLAACAGGSWQCEPIHSCPILCTSPRPSCTCGTPSCDTATHEWSCPSSCSHPCGDLACRVDQVCAQQSGGPLPLDGGSVMTFACVAVPAACATKSNQAPTCQCLNDELHRDIPADYCASYTCSMVDGLPLLLCVEA